MKVLFADIDGDLKFENSGEGREPGVHLSDILSRMAWERDRKYDPDAPKDLMVFEQGFTWETVLERALSARHQRAGYRPDAVQEDGVWMSPDHVNPDGDIQLEEWKATKKSSKNLLEKIHEWIPQGQCYLRALAKRRIVKRLAVRWRVWCIVGDWSFESKGDLTLLRDYYRVDIEFDKRELEDRWSAVLQAGRKYGLLKAAPQEREWRRPRLEATIKRRMTETKRKKVGSQPSNERVTRRLLTFQRMKTSSKRRAES